MKKHTYIHTRIQFLSLFLFFSSLSLSLSLYFTREQARFLSLSQSIRGFSSDAFTLSTHSRTHSVSVKVDQRCNTSRLIAKLRGTRTLTVRFVVLINTITTTTTTTNITTTTISITTITTTI